MELESELGSRIIGLVGIDDDTKDLLLDMLHELEDLQKQTRKEK